MKDVLIGLGFVLTGIAVYGALGLAIAAVGVILIFVDVTR